MVIFKGSILGGVCEFWGNPYLNSTTVLFDNYYCYCINLQYKHTAILVYKRACTCIEGLLATNASSLHGYTVYQYNNTKIS